MTASSSQGSYSVLAAASSSQGSYSRPRKTEKRIRSLARRSCSHVLDLPRRSCSTASSHGPCSPLLGLLVPRSHDSGGSGREPRKTAIPRLWWERPRTAKKTRPASRSATGVGGGRRAPAAVSRGGVFQQVRSSIMYDGARIGRNHRSGSSAAACLNQEPRKPLRNHAAANLRSLREKQDQVGGYVR